ncbi:ABC transporter substrate binding protein [Lacticaseibacillus jixianensis]|uniref:ABC transporter substrate binding protein n=1 Tax=Lacticaseibacillus jixianensis TaxID=2486012 RepID=A0ABW4B6X2_9LACO|nr:ABC transporter substrate-binding protein [Lacticaseibacillus jixianensis]
MKLNHLALGLAAVATLVLAGCSSSASAKTQGKPVKIGILQLINQTGLDDARKGFEQELAKQGYKGAKVKLDYVNAQGDQSNLQSMSQRLKQDKNDVNLAIATPAAQALMKADKQTPMVFTAVTDPQSAGLVQDPKHPSANTTGVTDMTDIKSQLKYLKQLFPKTKTVGMLYNAAEQNSVVQIKTATKAAKQLGLKVALATVASTNDVQSATESLAGKADALYLVTDNTVAAAMPTVGKVSLKKHVPAVCAASTMVQDGGVATKGLSYKELGRQTARMAIKILKGKKVAELPVESPAKTMVVKNEKMMKAFGLTDADVEK